MTEERILTDAEKEVIEMRAAITKAGGLFECRVLAYQEANRCSASEAIRTMIERDPKAHADYLERVKTGNAGSLTGGASNA